MGKGRVIGCGGGEGEIDKVKIGAHTRAKIEGEDRTLRSQRDYMNRLDFLLGLLHGFYGHLTTVHRAQITSNAIRSMYL